MILKKNALKIFLLVFSIALISYFIFNGQRNYAFGVLLGNIILSFIIDLLSTKSGTDKKIPNT